MEPGASPGTLGSGRVHQESINPGDQSSDFQPFCLGNLDVNFSSESFFGGIFSPPGRVPRSRFPSTQGPVVAPEIRLSQVMTTFDREQLTRPDGGRSEPAGGSGDRPRYAAVY